MSNNQKFLFINKNASSKSLSRSQGEERFQILSHVQPSSRSTARRRGEAPLKSAARKKASGRVDAEVLALDVNRDALSLSTSALSTAKGCSKQASEEAMTLAQTRQTGSPTPSTYYLSPVLTLGIPGYETRPATLNEYLGMLVTWCG
jgi:hypothetical protein